MSELGMIDNNCFHKIVAQFKILKKRFFCQTSAKPFSMVGTKNFEASNNNQCDVSTNLNIEE